MDNFEKYINENRGALDDLDAVPMEAMWAKIQGDTAMETNANLELQSKNQQRKIRVLRGWVMGLAASILALVVAGIGLWPSESSSDEVFTHFANPLTVVSEDLADTEQEFKRMIHQKEEEINAQNIDKQLFIEIFKELELLEKIHLEYQQDIPEFQEKEALIQTLTRYYEQKIRILERLSREIEQQNYYQKKIYEKHL